MASRHLPRLFSGATAAGLAALMLISSTLTARADEPTPDDVSVVLSEGATSGQDDAATAEKAAPDPEDSPSPAPQPTAPKAESSVPEHEPSVPTPVPTASERSVTPETDSPLKPELSAPTGLADAALLAHSAEVPAASDVMPDGPLKRAIQMYQGLEDFSYATTSTLTRLGTEDYPNPSIYPWDVWPGEDWWTGAEFLPQLRSLELAYGEFGAPNEGLGHYLPNLTSLSLQMAVIDSAALGRLEHLESLVWRNTGGELSEGILSWPSLYPRLDSLQLASLSAGDRLSGIAEMANLRSVSITYVDPAGDLTALSGSTALESLVIDGGDFSGTGFPALTHLPNLKSLSVTQARLTQAPDIAGIPSLESLLLSGNEIAVFPALQAPNLKTLDLSRNWLTEVQFATEADLPALMSLDLSSNSSLQWFSWPSRAPMLASLNLVKTGITTLANMSIEVEIGSLDLRESKLIDLSGLDRLALVESAHLGGSGLLDLSGATRYADNPTKVVVQQPIPIRNNPPGAWVLDTRQVSVGSLQRLGSVVRLPEDSVVTFDPDTWSNAHAGDEPNSFVVEDAGPFSVDLTIPPVGNISFHTVHLEGMGEASLPGVTLTATGPTEPVAVGEPMRFAGDVAWAGDPGEVTSYQWYSSPKAITGPSDATPIEGADGLSLEVVNSKDTGHLKYALVAFVGDTPVVSNTVTPQALVEFADPELARCVQEFHGGPLSYAGLAKPSQLASHDCSARGITSLEGLQWVKGIERGIAGGQAAQLNLSHNEITDIGPIAAMSSGQFDLDVDLTYNKIADVSALWAVDDPQWLVKNYRVSRNSGFNLDHNQVADLSGLATLKAADPHNPTVALSFLDQLLVLPGVQVGETLTLPAVGGPDGQPARFATDDGTLTEEGTIVFDSPGVKTISWERVNAQYTRFSGVIEVTVGGSAGPILAVSPQPPKAGQLMTFAGSGFQPGERVKATWNGEPLLSATANAAGGVTWFWRVADPAQSGPVTVAAQGEESTVRASVSFTLNTDDVLKVPDAGLLACFKDALGLDGDAVLYASLAGSLNGTLDCRGRGIKDLTGLDGFQPSNGEVLLSGNALTSLTSLPTMAPGVWRVDVSNNTIRETGGMQPQVNLMVYAGGNQITDFRELQKASWSVRGIGLDQQIQLPIALAGQPVQLPEVQVSPLKDNAGVLSQYTVDYVFPDGASEDEGAVRFTQPGSYEIGFLVYLQGESSTGSHFVDAPWASGTFGITVVEPYDKVLTINPDELFAGQLLNATGAGFTPGEKVLFTVGKAPAVILGEAVADNRGVARVTDAVVPSSFAPGAYQVGARGLTSGVEVYTPLTVKAPARPAKGLNINPRELFPGQVLNAIGSGFTPGESVRFTLGAGGHLLGQAVANDRGVVSLTNALVPSDTKVGSHTVVATGASSGVRVQTGLKVLAVEPSPSQPSTPSRPGGQTSSGSAPGGTATGALAGLTSGQAAAVPAKVLNINPGKLYPGQLLNAIAAGFTPGEQVNLTLGEAGVFLAKAEASALGVANFTNVMIPPGTKPGDYLLVAKGQASGAAVTTSLTVNSGQVPGQVLNINPGQLYAGQLLNAIGAGFAAGERVTFTLGEGGPLLGSSTASERGIASITDAVVPREVLPGNYELVARGESSGVVVRAQLTIQAVQPVVASGEDAPAPVAVAEPDVTPTPVQPDGQGVVIALVALALFLIGAAGVMLIGRKR